MIDQEKIIADIEKVIRGWERCLKHTCPMPSSKEYRECEYTMGLYCRQDNLIYDTLEILKEELKRRREENDRVYSDYKQASMSRNT